MTPTVHKGLFGMIAVGLLLLGGCGDSSLTTTPSGLRYKDEQVGQGAVAKKDDMLEVQYTGLLRDGKKFDSSHDRGVPLFFLLGRGKVIRGWDEGIKGMKEGGKRKLVIPADLAYGERGAPPTIPPGAELTFDVELLGVYNHLYGGMYKRDLEPGKGEAVKDGDKVEIQYTGSLNDSGKQIGKGTADLVVGDANFVPRGLSLGVSGMKPGGRRKLIVPYTLGFGAWGKDLVPANAELMYEVELVKVK